MTGPPPADGTGGVTLTDIASVPDEPPAALLYHHRPALIQAAGRLVTRWEVILTLAERDLRAAYKQAVLGFAWALLNPVLSLLLFTIIFHKAFTTGPLGEPYPLFAYIGILVWGFFAGAVGGGASSLLQNKVMMAKTHFPRECFPLSQIVESAFTSVIASSLLLILFPFYGYLPKLGILWTPLYLLIEVPFIIGIVLISSSVVVQMRDLSQLVSMGMQLGMFASPVVWNFSKVPGAKFGIPHAWQPLYSVINPLGPVIDGIRRSTFQGLSPDWALLGVAAVGSLLYMVGGFALFKRLEVNFADLA